MRRSIRFQVSGIEGRSRENWGRSIRAKEGHKGPTSTTYPTCLKWDHISDLEVADPECRTPACIDLLLGAEVFTSILCACRRTGPRGTPSAINTCLGWVLFGKIQYSDVVDVAKYSLEQDELKYLTGSGRSYAAVLTTADKKDDLHPPRRRNGRVTKGLPLDSKRDFNHDDCRITRPGFGKTGPRNLRGIENLHVRWRNVGKPSGFGRRYVGSISPLIRFN